MRITRALGESDMDRTTRTPTTSRTPSRHSSTSQTSWPALATTSRPSSVRRQPWCPDWHGSRSYLVERMTDRSDGLQVVRTLGCGMRIGQRPAAKSQLCAYSRHVLTPRQLVSDAHDEFTDIGVGDRQPAFVAQLRCDCSDLLSGEATGEQREQGDIVPLRNSLRVARPQPVDDCRQERGQRKLRHAGIPSLSVPDGKWSGGYRPATFTH